MKWNHYRFLIPILINQLLLNRNGAPYGTRTRVTAVRGRRPRPLDEGSLSVFCIDLSQR